MCFNRSCVVVQVDLFVLDRSPQTLNEDIVQSSTPTIHADPDIVVFKDADELDAGELDSLIPVEFLR